MGTQIDVRVIAKGGKYLGDDGLPTVDGQHRRRQGDTHHPAAARAARPTELR
jgi:hypothetical protein